MNTNLCRFLVFVGSSGSGKTHLAKRVHKALLEKGRKSFMSVSITTREPRINKRTEEYEIHNLDYIFLKKDEVVLDELLEYEQIPNSEGSLETYGTPLLPIDAAYEPGATIILVLEIKGLLTLKKKIPEIYGRDASLHHVVMTASDEVILERLKNDGFSESEAMQRMQRIDIAKQIEEHHLQDDALVTISPDTYNPLSLVINKLDNATRKKEVEVLIKKESTEPNHLSSPTLVR